MPTFTKHMAFKLNEIEFKYYLIIQPTVYMVIIVNYFMTAIKYKHFIL